MNKGFRILGGLGFYPLVKNHNILYMVFELWMALF